MRCATAVSLLFVAGASVQAATRVSIAVFTLFRPARLVLRAAEACILNDRPLQAGGMAEIGREPARLESRAGGPAVFTLTVPGKISREFRGSLRTSSTSGVVTAVVTMDLETAVAAALAAEMPAGAEDEALAAMAVAIRSFYAAGPRHSGFDFCDSTHCQFHRSPARTGSPALRAANRTRGVVLTFDGEVFAPYYSAACGGRTRTPEQVGLPGGRFPYRSVECPYCMRGEPSWRREVPYEVGSDLAQLRSEQARLIVARAMGWSKAPPGNNYSVRQDGSILVFEGSGRGHGIGMCQRGAMGMAHDGASWRAILEYYLPNAALRLPDTAMRIE